MATIIKNSAGFFEQGNNGLAPITDPVQLQDLNSGATPYMIQQNGVLVPNTSSAVNGSTSTTPSTGVSPTLAPAGTGVSTSPAGSPYDTFNTAMVNLLKWGQGQTSSANAALASSKEQLTNTGLNLSNPLADTPYAPYLAMEGPGATASEGDIQNSVAPGITSITDQMALNNSAAQNMNSIAQTALALKGTYTEMVNPSTGLPDGFNSVTGTWASADNAPVPPAGSSASSGLIGGVDFSGAATSTQPYATDPNYTTEIGGIYNVLKQNIPQATTQNLDAYISIAAQKSPLTGQMIVNAANSYGIDPLLLTAVLNHESDFGTTGQGSEGTYNPGNTQINGQDIAYSSWQQGVNAAAGELAKRMPGNTNAPNKGSTATSAPAQTTAPTADPTGDSYSTAYQARVAKLPAPVQKFSYAGPGGVAYIDGDAATAAGLGQTAAIAGAAAGIPVLTGDGTSIMDNLNNLTEQMQTMQNLVNQNLSSGSGNSPLGFIVNSFNSTLNSTIQTSPSIAKFNSYIGGVTAAANNLKALAGGAGSGLRITGAELAGTVDNLPSSSDSWQTANAKIQAINLKISQVLHTQFPDVDPNSTVLPATQATGSGTSSNSGGSTSGSTYNGITLPN